MARDDVPDGGGGEWSRPQTRQSHRLQPRDSSCLVRIHQSTGNDDEEQLRGRARIRSTCSPKRLETSQRLVRLIVLSYALHLLLRSFQARLVARDNSVYDVDHASMTGSLVTKP
jgi:hypothetical protein